MILKILRETGLCHQHDVSDASRERGESFDRDYTRHGQTFARSLIGSINHGAGVMCKYNAALLRALG